MINPGLAEQMKMTAEARKNYKDMRNEVYELLLDEMAKTGKFYTAHELSVMSGLPAGTVASMLIRWGRYVNIHGIVEKHKRKISKLYRSIDDPNNIISITSDVNVYRVRKY